MADPYLSEIKLAAFTFAPKGWALCDGQLLQINQNQALFSLLGTTYGGDGRTTFALPDLRGRMPVHEGDGIVRGQAGGEFEHTLTLAELPTHNHRLNGSTAMASSSDPNGALLARKGRLSADIFNGSSDVSLVPATVAGSGGSQQHQNTQPYLALNFIIALQGIFPSSN
ncbi:MULTISPECIES: phage tail protein [unclassified Duganella]|uniref:phage tail protein n=1 Tax=unclassified Duganella TaxID=2636909 RepID=UPI0006F27347|nr:MULTISPECIES: tail fiber protein [unclassified Duganella]KQV59777.1 phage tail protein [Duganella sp. Root336D2]KRB87256.1 phage tail protein [Duganella sp. Root198D2]